MSFQRELGAWPQGISPEWGTEMFGNFVAEELAILHGSQAVLSDHIGKDAQPDLGIDVVAADELVIAVTLGPLVGRGTARVPSDADVGLADGVGIERSRDLERNATCDDPVGPGARESHIAQLADDRVGHFRTCLFDYDNGDVAASKLAADIFVAGRDASQVFHDESSLVGARILELVTDFFISCIKITVKFAAGMLCVCNAVGLRTTAGMLPG